VKIPVYNMAGAVVRQIEVNDSVFAQPANEAVVHQALVAQLANARQGTSDTKTRSEVSGSTRKLYRQKGTGRARAGSIKSGLRRGGAIIFGPHPRDYSKALPKKMRQLAIRCVLSTKASDKTIKILDELKLDAPKTKDMAQLLKTLDIQKSVVIALHGNEENVLKSTRNLPGVKTLPARQLNVVDMLAHESLVMTETALREIEELWGGAA
jgi:large subunit ribosomal protein L4